ncbi:MAG TPA: BatA domain-containing protein, partial [Chthonomonadales bacterium]|nr:BatA domain-containing protein [Chthonomonadales bacterium]
MSYLNPAFLSALGLAAIPLVIHLIRKRKLRVIRWAAMEFLLQSMRKQRRRMRIEEWILLALRILIVAMAVFAFARPVLHALGAGLLPRSASVYAVIA